MPQLIVEPQHYAAASTIIGDTVAVAGYRDLLVLADALSRTGGMGGSDPAGSAWAADYDRAASAATRAAQDVVNSCYHLASLLQQTGFNYDLAESASAGLSVEHVEAFRWDGLHVTLSPPPAARGGGGDEPSGWSLVSHLIAAIWPNGHQDRLRTAAAAWNTCASRLAGVAQTVLEANTSIAFEDTPESDAALAACHAVRLHLLDVVDAQRAIAAACEGYATHLDTVHSAVISELRSLIEWTVGIEVGGGLLSLVTLGLAEAPTQAAEAARIAKTAGEITRIIRTLDGLAAGARATLATAGDRAAAVSLRVQAVLRTDRVIARVTVLGRDAGMVRIGKGAEGAAHAELTEAAEIRRVAAQHRWSNWRTLEGHYDSHVGDFGSMTIDEYAQQARAFFERGLREGLPMKVDKTKGVIRIFDPATRTFGSYTRSGETRTFFRPSSPTYWDRQSGELT
jgi:hypothetical protein